MCPERREGKTNYIHIQPLIVVIYIYVYVKERKSQKRLKKTIKNKTKFNTALKTEP